LPTKFGQNLIVEKNADHKIHWKSFDADGKFGLKKAFRFQKSK
jgi:hypothetical protein